MKLNQVNGGMIDDSSRNDTCRSDHIHVYVTIDTWYMDGVTTTVCNSCG